MLLKTEDPIHLVSIQKSRSSLMLSVNPTFIVSLTLMMFLREPQESVMLMFQERSISRIKSLQITSNLLVTLLLLLMMLVTNSIVLPE